MKALSWRSSAAAGMMPAPHHVAHGRRATVVVQASSAPFLNPHKVLGVSANADVKEVKRAYRMKALQLHPDRCKEENGHQRFMELTQAYEMLLGRAEGKTDSHYSNASGWDFHDWYWSFRMQRSWEKQNQRTHGSAAGAAGAAAGGSDEHTCGSTFGNRPPTHAGFKQPEARDNLRSQLAGLRHRAAVRANRGHSATGRAAGAAARADPEDWADGTLGEPRSSFASMGSSYDSSEDEEDGGDGYEQLQQEDEQLRQREQQQQQRAVSAERRSRASAEALYGQFTHVMDTSVYGSMGEVSMSVQDGQYGTRVSNHAVPLSAAASAAYTPSHTATAEQPAAAHAGHAEAAAAEAQAEEAPASNADGDPEPFSAPFSATNPAGQRKRFVASGDKREAVTHQLAGLRRKAALKTAV